jgi:hypothetical protein
MKSLDGEVVALKRQVQITPDVEVGCAIFPSKFSNSFFSVGKEEIC